MKTAKKIIFTATQLKECFAYDEATGVLLWKERPAHHFKKESTCKAWNTKYSGKEAGATVQAKNGKYSKVTISINGQSGTYFSHRVCWKMATGGDPSKQIDHIDGNGLNNAFDNLRDVSAIENQKNQKKPKNNKSGVMGISYRPENNKWAARICVDWDQIVLGDFEIFDQAVAARKSALKKYKFHDNHGRKSQEQDIRVTGNPIALQMSSFYRDDYLSLLTKYEQKKIPKHKHLIDELVDGWLSSEVYENDGLASQFIKYHTREIKRIEKQLKTRGT